jgi:hypothetical protein
MVDCLMDDFRKQKHCDAPVTMPSLQGMKEKRGDNDGRL